MAARNRGTELGKERAAAGQEDKEGQGLTLWRGLFLHFAAQPCMDFLNRIDSEMTLVVQCKPRLTPELS